MRKKTIEVKVRGLGIGANNPVRVQSMTNTDTADIEATAKQTIELYNAGSELVRFTVENDAMAKAVPGIRKELARQGFEEIPLIGDFHYNGHLLLTKYPEMAQELDKYRINPGNVGFGERHDPNFQAFIDVAGKYEKPVRIGVNWGSLDQGVLTKMMDENLKRKEQKTAKEITVEAVVESAVQSIKKAIEYGLPENQIIVSTKISEVPEMVHAYEMLSQRTTQPLHVGLTEAGMGSKGIVASSSALSLLLTQGIGDTIRVSLTPKPGASRTEEVIVCNQILQSLGIRSFSPSVTSCPGCGRTTSTRFQELTEEMNSFIQEKMPQWKKKGFKGVEEMKVAVMGCIVNGPGESKYADIGISLPGSGEDPMCPIFEDGKLVKSVKASSAKEEFKKQVEKYAERRYATETVKE